MTRSFPARTCKDRLVRAACVGNAVEKVEPVGDNVGAFCVDPARPPCAVRCDGGRDLPLPVLPALPGSGPLASPPIDKLPNIKAKHERLGRQHVCRFLGRRPAIPHHAHHRPASEKRQGRKSREVGPCPCGGLYGD